MNLEKLNYLEKNVEIHRSITLYQQKAFEKQQNFINMNKLIYEKKNNFNNFVLKMHLDFEKSPEFVRFVAGCEPALCLQKKQIEMFPQSLLYYIVACFSERNGKYELDATHQVLNAISLFFSGEEENQSEADIKILKEWGFCTENDSTNDPCLNQHCQSMVDQWSTLNEIESQLINSLHTEKRAIERKLSVFQKYKKKANTILNCDFITLDVRGHRYSISKEKLLNQEDSFFAKLLCFGEESKNSKEYFIGRDSSLFYIIHHYLVTGKVDQFIYESFHHLFFDEKQTFLEDIDFYGIHWIEDELNTFDKSKIVQNIFDIEQISISYGTNDYYLVRDSFHYEKILKNSKDSKHQKHLWIFEDDNTIYTACSRTKEHWDQSNVGFQNFEEDSENNYLIKNVSLGNSAETDLIQNNIFEILQKKYDSNELELYFQN